MLQDSDVATRLPAQDLARARAFYAEQLDLEPVEERPGGLRYQCGSGRFSLFESAGAASGTHTQMAWEVDDLVAVVAELRRRGVMFEQVDLPGLRTMDGIAQVEGNYPSAGVGELAAWFRDSEGNLLGLAKHSAQDQHPLRTRGALAERGVATAARQPGDLCRPCLRPSSGWPSTSRRCQPPGRPPIIGAAKAFEFPEESTIR